MTKQPTTGYVLLYANGHDWNPVIATGDVIDPLVKIATDIAQREANRLAGIMQTYSAVIRTHYPVTKPGSDGMSYIAFEQEDVSGNWHAILDLKIVRTKFYDKDTATGVVWHDTKGRAK